MCIQWCGALVKYGSSPFASECSESSALTEPFHISHRFQMCFLNRWLVFTRIDGIRRGKNCSGNHDGTVTPIWKEAEPRRAHNKGMYRHFIFHYIGVFGHEHFEDANIWFVFSANLIHSVQQSLLNGNCQANILAIICSSNVAVAHHSNQNVQINRYFIINEITFKLIHRHETQSSARNDLNILELILPHSSTKFTYLSGDHRRRSEKIGTN